MAAASRSSVKMKIAFLMIPGAVCIAEGHLLASTGALHWINAVVSTASTLSQKDLHLYLVHVA